MVRAPATPPHEINGADDAGGTARRGPASLPGVIRWLAPGITVLLDQDVTGPGAAPEREPLAVPVVTTPVAHDLLPAGAVRFAGRARGAVRVSLWENGGYLASAPVDADGRWTWAGHRPWRMGVHTVRSFAVDADGVESGRVDTRFTVSERATVRPGGIAAPVVHLPEEHQRVPDTDIGFAGTAVGAVQVGFSQNGLFLGACEVAPDGRWAWNSAGPWSAGRHTVEVFAVDADGDGSPSAALPLTVVREPALAGR